MVSDRAFQILAGLSWPRRLEQPTQLADELVGAAQQSLPVSGVGLAWMNEGEPGVLVAATDERARRIEELQFTLGEGPCLTSTARGRPVLVDDLLSSGSLWPAFTVEALEAGVAAVFAFPLRVGGVGLGVLDLYRRTPGPLSPGDRAEALAFATVATWMLMQVGPGIMDERRYPEWADRLSGRLEVHRAAGYVAAELSVSVPDALLLLRARAVADQRPVSAIAHAVLAQVVTIEL